MVADAIADSAKKSGYETVKQRRCSPLLDGHPSPCYTAWHLDDRSTASSMDA